MAWRDGMTHDTVHDHMSHEQAQSHGHDLMGSELDVYDDFDEPTLDEQYDAQVEPMHIDALQACETAKQSHGQAYISFRAARQRLQEARKDRWHKTGNRKPTSAHGHANAPHHGGVHAEVRRLHRVTRVLPVETPMAPRDPHMA